MKDQDQDRRPEQAGLYDPHHRAAHRLHPHPHLPDRGHHTGPQIGRSVRGLRSADGVARPGRRVAGRVDGNRLARFTCRKGYLPAGKYAAEVRGIHRGCW